MSDQENQENQEEQQAAALAKLQELSAKDLVIRALRLTLEYPISRGVVPKDCAANARLLMELSGDLGKHSKPPTDPDQPAHEMTHEQLTELADRPSLDPQKPKRTRKSKT